MINARSSPGARGAWRTCLHAVLAICAVMMLSTTARASGPLPALPQESAEWLVRMAGDIAPDAAREDLIAGGLQPLEWLAPLGIWRVRSVSDSGASAQSVSRVLGDRALWVEENAMACAQERVPNDPYYATQQWSLPLIGLDLVWDDSLGNGKVIAIIDSGIDLAHPDLVGKLWANPLETPANGVDDDANSYVDDIVGWDFVSGDGVPEDGYGHGTHVSGIAGAATNNEQGIAGAAWGSRLMILRALGDDGRGTYANIALAIHYAADNGADVINLSLGGTAPSTALAEQIVYATDHGCLVVAAAGNSGVQGVLYPAAIDGVLGIAASTSLDQPYSGNSRGPELDVTAPGVGIYATLRSGLYGVMTGTSMATPHVSAVAALLQSYRTDLTWQQTAQAITSTAVDIDVPGWDDRTGWGRIDAAAALASIPHPSYPYHLMLPLIYTQSGED